MLRQQTRRILASALSTTPLGVAATSVPASSVRLACCAVGTASPPGSCRCAAAAPAVAAPALASSSSVNVTSRRHASSSDSGSAAEFQMPQFENAKPSEFPIVQLPAESLWCKQAPVALCEIKTQSFRRMLQRLLDARKHYQYPSMSAPQIGWNVSVFVLYDGSVWINPSVDRVYSDQTCWTWEPCASCGFLMHYIERPHEIVASAYDGDGALVDKVKLDGMRSRLVQHEMDHLTGVLFTRRIPDSLHVVPMDGFHLMSDWAEDFPSIEARSTNLYTLYFAPLKFVPHFLPESDIIKRHYEDNIFPGHELVRKCADEETRHHSALVAFIEQQMAQGLWKGSVFSHKRRGAVGKASPAADAAGAVGGGP